MAIQIASPFEMFNGLDGKPLSNGKVYIGQIGTDPTVVANQIPVFWDEELTIPAAQPLVTNAGYIVRFGTPARVYTATDYSMSVRNASNMLVYYIAEFGAVDYASNADLTALSGALQLADYAALRSYTGSRNIVYLAGDGIAGTFRRALSGTDNGGTVIVANNGVIWSRIYSGAIEVDWFGAYGVTDSKASIMSAIAAAQSIPHGGTIAFRAGATYRLLSGLTWNSTLVGANGRGAFIDCTNAPAGTIVLAPTQYGIDDNERVGAAQMHPWENFIFRGPGYAATTVVWLRINAPETEAVNAGTTFRSNTVQSFAVDIQLQRGAFFTTFTLCDFQGVNGSGVDTTKPIQVSAGVNNGERTTFDNCLMGNRNFLFDQTNPNADTLFLNCSLNFPGQNIATVSGGMVTFIGCHTEGLSDIDRWIQVSGQDSLVNITKHQLVINADKNNFSPFYSDPSCTRGGIIINGLKVNSQAVRTYLVDGMGRAKVSDITQSNGSVATIASLYLNLLSYPSFESPNYTADWTLLGTTPPARTNAITPHSGTWSLAFTPAPGAPLTTAAYAQVDCRPGDFAALEFWYTTATLTGTGGTFAVEGQFVDKSGVVIGTAQGILATQANVGTWTKVSAGSDIAAPAGTNGFRMYVSLFGASSGTPKGYLDSVAITVS